MKKNKLLSLLASAAMVTSLVVLPTTVNAAEAIEIDTVEELKNAIANQADGQTWLIKSGEYVLPDSFTVEKPINGNYEFVLPIYANNLSIEGEGEVLITSSYDPTEYGDSGQEWHWQNFMTVAGNDVSINNVNLQGNPNGGFDDSCNKVIEVFGAKNFSLTNSTLKPLQDKDGKLSSGSIYFTTADAGTSRIENVEMSSWVTARDIETGNLNVTNLTQDFTNNTYAGYYDDTYGYAWYPGVSGTNVKLDNYTIKVDNKSNFVKQISDRVRPGTTIELTEDIFLTEEMYLKDVSNVTIKGNGHTISAADDFKMNSEGQIQLTKVENGENVVFENVILVGTEKTKHVLDIYDASVTLNNVTLDHSGSLNGAPAVVNGGKLNLLGNTEMILGEHSWGAVNLGNNTGDASKLPEITIDEKATVELTTPEGKEDTGLYYVDKDEDTGEPVTETKVTIPENFVAKINDKEVVLKEDGTTEDVIRVESIKLNKDKLELTEGASETLTAKINPKDVTFDTLTWTSSDEKVATVKDGKVTAVKAGTATITVTVDGKSATCAVTVKAKEVEQPEKEEITVTIKGIADGKEIVSEVVPEKLPKGYKVTAEDMKELEDGLAELELDVENLKYKGIFLDKDGKQELEVGYVFNENTTLYMIWETNKETVTPKPEEPTTPPAEEKPDDKVDTSDTNSTAIYAAAMGMAVLAAGVVVLNKKKEELMK